MNEIIKKRYQELKDRNSNFVREKKWESNALLQECLLALDNNKKIINIEQQQQILTKFNSDLTKLTDSYRKKSIKTIQELLPQWINKSVYIIWDKEDLPIIQTDFECALDNIDDIIAVAFETWVVAIEMNQFIQFNTRNKIVEISLEDD